MQQVKQEFKAHRELLALKDLKVHKVPRGIKAHKGSRATQARLALRDHRVYRVRKEPQARLVRKV